MFHKRLLKEFRDNQKYVAGMVAAQWGILLANVILMLAAADFIGEMRAASLETARILRILLILAAVLLVRGIMNSLNSRFSFRASTEVKRRLRE